MFSKIYVIYLFCMLKYTVYIICQSQNIGIIMSVTCILVWLLAIKLTSNHGELYNSFKVQTWKTLRRDHKVLLLKISLAFFKKTIFLFHGSIVLMNLKCKKRAQRLFIMPFLFHFVGKWFHVWHFYYVLV